MCLTLICEQILTAAHFSKKQRKRDAYLKFGNSKSFESFDVRLELEISNQLRTILDELHIINFILHRQKEIIVRFHKKLEILKLDCGKLNCGKSDHGKLEHGTFDHGKLNCGKLHHVEYKIEEYIVRIECLFQEAVRVNKAVS
jgi:hypothetical protein